MTRGGHSNFDQRLASQLWPEVGITTLTRDGHRNLALRWAASQLSIIVPLMYKGKLIFKALIDTVNSQGSKNVKNNNMSKR